MARNGPFCPLEGRTNHLWHSVSVRIRLNAQNHHFTTSQGGSLQMPVKENPTPKCFIQKRGFLIHVIEKFWRQARRDPRAHTRSGAAASSTALHIMLASFSGFLCWQTVAVTLNLLSDLLCAQGERELLPPPPAPHPLPPGLCRWPPDEKNLLTFHCLRFCHESTPDGGKRNMTPTQLKFPSLNLTTHLESHRRRRNG